MLLYDFGSKEQMISAALLAAGARFPVLHRAFEVLDDDRRPLERRLHDAWRAISAEANLPFIRLVFEVFGLAAHQPGRCDGFLGQVGQDWAERVAVVLPREGLSVIEAGRTGREVVALWRGLQLELLSSGARRRIDRTHGRAAVRIAALVTGA